VENLEATMRIYIESTIPSYVVARPAHKLDILLTWNCRHIANAAIVGRLRRLVETQGHTLPEIYTPEELLGE
jgi:hypothetical protein